MIKAVMTTEKMIKNIIALFVGIFVIAHEVLAARNHMITE